MSMHIDNYQWHEFFPHVSYNVGVIIAVWAPIVLVYFMDAQIWYAIFSTIFGGIDGAFSHLGEIRTLGMLQSRFEAIPSAFSERLVLSSDRDSKGKNMDESLVRKNITNFSHVWNGFILTMQQEDLMSNRSSPQSSSVDIKIGRSLHFLLTGTFMME